MNRLMHSQHKLLHLRKLIQFSHKSLYRPLRMSLHTPIQKTQQRSFQLLLTNNSLLPRKSSHQLLHRLRLSQGLSQGLSQSLYQSQKSFRSNYYTKFQQNANAHSGESTTQSLLLLLKYLYISGVIVVAPTIFIGNVYNGFMMSLYECDSHYRFSGFLFGVIKMSYGLTSWGFIGYAIYRHVHRVEIAKKTVHSDRLTGDYAMHFMPDALNNLDKCFVHPNLYPGLNKLFIEYEIKSR